MITPEEVEVARRNLLAELKAESIGNPEGLRLEAHTVRDLVAVLEALAPVGPAGRITVSEYAVYPTGYHETEIPSDKYRFTITVKDRGKGWAVCWMGDVLNRDGEWEWEVQPSSRDDEFYRRCRFTEKEAQALAAEHVDKLTINGRTFAEAIRHVKEREQS